MPYETDERLKSFLDTNQLARERICLALLSSDRRFSEVRQRHPRGGPDGGRDIEAVFEGQLKTIGAVGFVNQASDSAPNQTTAKKKFKADMDSALAEVPALKVFVFFTNVNLTVSAKDVLTKGALAKGLGRCEIFDRERIRLFLDSVEGLAIRFQYLELSLSEAEQAAFFAKWGTEIQDMISEGFSKVEQSLARLQFLAEMALPLTNFYVVLELDKEYSGAEIGHFRAFCSMHIGEFREQDSDFLFGESDDPNRSEAKSVADLKPEFGGIQNGIYGAQWKQPSRAEAKEAKQIISRRKDQNLMAIGSHTSVGRTKVNRIAVALSFGAFLRMPGQLKLSDIDGCLAVMFLSESLSKKVRRALVFGNEYKLADIPITQASFSAPNEDPEIPMLFSEDELRDKWVRMMFGEFVLRVDFSGVTPKRMFSPNPIA